ncbi:MAG TPA: hypothetical protein VF855_12105, partial [Acidimicrobiales bacterium]
MSSPNSVPVVAPAEPKKRRTLRYVLLGAVVLAVLVGIGLWWFLRDDAPPEAGLVNRSSTTAPDGASTSVGDATTVPATPDGVWKVQAGDGVFAGYRVQE